MSKKVFQNDGENDYMYPISLYLNERQYVDIDKILPSVKDRFGDIVPMKRAVFIRSLVQRELENKLYNKKSSSVKKAVNTVKKTFNGDIVKTNGGFKDGEKK